MRSLLAVASLASLLGAQQLQFFDYPDPPAFLPLAQLSQPRLLALADFDADGDSDAAASTRDATFVLRNEGDQVWTPVQVLPIPATALHWADLDADGDPDLLLGGQNLAHSPLPFGVVRNDAGAFTWSGQQTIPCGPGTIIAVATGDVDGDGDLDAVLGCRLGWPSSVGPALHLARNDGTGWLQPEPAALPALGGSHYAGLLLDADGDGDLDLVAAQDGAGLVLLVNGGAGTFTDGSAALPAGASAERLAAADLDGDGHADLVTCDGGLAVLWGGPGGTWAAPQPLPAGASPAREPVPVDVDGDGALDLVVRTGRGLEQRRATGPRSFGLEVLFDGGSATVGLGVGDTMARGRADAICTFLDGTHRLALAGDQGLQPEPGPRLPADLGVKATGDLDGDGLDDVVVLSDTDLQALRARGRGGWQATTSPVAPAATWQHLRLGDLDGDGQLDAVALGTGLGPLLVLLRLPQSLQFAAQPPIGLLGPTDLDTGDVDGDGDVDVVVATGNGVRWLANPGDGALLGPAAVPGAPAGVAEFVRLRDIDRDGDPDLVLGPQAGSLVVLWNDGAGGFAPGPGLAVPGTAVAALTVADLDLDGWLDVACVAAPDQRLVWYRQQAPGSFVARPPSAPLGVTPTELHAADFDADGDVDLLLGGDPALLLRHDGGGVFTADPAALPSGRHQRLAVVDLDEDGDPDLLADGPSPLEGRELENVARSARPSYLPRVGGTLSIWFGVDPFAGAAGTFVIPAAGFGRPPGLQIAGVAGALLVGAGHVTLPWVTLPAPQGTGTSMTAIPPDPTLAGIRLAIQGLVVSPAQVLGFTNVVDETIRP